MRLLEARFSVELIYLPHHPKSLDTEIGFHVPLPSSFAFGVGGWQCSNFLASAMNNLSVLKAGKAGREREREREGMTLLAPVSGNLPVPSLAEFVIVRRMEGSPKSSRRFVAYNNVAVSKNGDPKIDPHIL